MTRPMASEYMHWAKFRRPATYNLSASDMPHFRLDSLPLTIADLDLDGASHPRYPPLRAAIAARYGVAPEQVVAADGTSMATFLALSILVAPGDEVLVEWPVYEPLLAAIRHVGATVTRVKRRIDEGFRLHPDDVAAALTDRMKLIVTTNLHNPASALTSHADLAAIGAHARAAGARALVDEVFLDTVPNARSAALLGPEFVTVSSLTKSYGLSGLRCGWVLAEPELAERMWRFNDLLGCNRAHQAERLACFAFAHLDAIVGDNPARVAANRALFDDFIAGRDDLDCMPAAHGLTAFPRWSGGDTKALDDRLRERFDTGVVPGHWFELPDRFRVGLSGDAAMLSEGLSRLGACFDSFR